MDTSLGSARLNCLGAYYSLDIVWTDGDQVALASFPGGMLPSDRNCDLTLSDFAAASDPSDPMEDEVLSFTTSLSAIEITVPGVWEDFNSFGICSFSCSNSPCWSSPRWDAGSGYRSWSVGDGLTDTSGTGPAGDHTYGLGHSDSRFLFTEASSCTFAEHAIVSGVLIRRAQLGVAFWAHLYGDGLPYSLGVDMRTFDGRVWSEWTELHARDGANVNAWVQVPIPAGSSLGKLFQVRVRGTTGSSASSDIAIDDFEAVNPDGTGVGPTEVTLINGGVSVVCFEMFCDGVWSFVGVGEGEGEKGLVGWMC